MPRSVASVAKASTSSAVAVMPVGLAGELKNDHLGLLGDRLANALDINAKIWIGVDINGHPSHQLLRVKDTSRSRGSKRMTSSPGSTIAIIANTKPPLVPELTKTLRWE